jgi:DNA-binding GntR family transcriptional regulator
MSTTPAGTPIQPVTLRGQVEAFLRQAIVEGRLEPGQRLIERELCEQLQISRPSLREALRLLEAERLIRIVPHRGPVVAAVSLQEARDLYALRALLEGFAARQFALHAADEPRTELREAVVALRAAARRQDAGAIVSAKTRFYGVLFRHCGNSLVERLFHGEMQRISLLRSTSLTRPERLAHSLGEIDAMVSAIERRDGDAAETLARHHVAQAEVAALAMLQAPADGGAPGGG